MTRVRCPGLRLFQTNLFIPTMALVDPGKCFRFNKLRFATGSHYITVMYTLPVRPQHVGFHTQRRNDLINDIGPISCLGLQESLSASSLILHTLRSPMAY